VILAWNSTADTVTSDVVSAWGGDGVTPTWATNWTAENTPQNLAPSNTWTRYSITATLDTASTNNVAVFIWCDDMTTTLGDFLYITDVQLEVGSLATPFERKTTSTVIEECQRYYQIWTSQALGTTLCLGISDTSGTAQAFTRPITPRMRVAPTNNWSGAIYATDYIVYRQLTALSSDRNTTDTFNTNPSYSGGTLNGTRPAGIYATGGYIDLVAEL
jgi:hypothetical protein